MGGPQSDDVRGAADEEGPPPSEDEIVELAYQTFLSSDRGSPDDNWQRNEAGLRLGPALRLTARPRIPPTG